MKKNSFKKSNIWFYAVITALTAASGIVIFARVFPAWNVIPYFLSMAILALAAGMLVWTYRKTRDLPHAALSALLGGVGFLIAAFGAVFLVNNVILRAIHADIAALVMSVVFALFFLTGAVLTAVCCVPKRHEKALVISAAAAMLAYACFTALGPVLPVHYEHPYTEKVTAAEVSKMEEKNIRLIVNADDSHWWGFFNELAENGTFDDVDMNAYVDQYAGTGVTDIMFNIFCQSSDVPSGVMTFRGDLYGQTEQNGNPVDYGNYVGLNEIYNVQKKDIFATWFDACRKNNINPWMSLRMNDCHDPEKETSQLRGELFYTARENGWMIGEEYGYFRNCLNYAVPEVRRLMLDYTREQLLKYDVYGLELDFMREIYCFDYLHADNEEIVEIMNGYMRDTALIVKEAEKKHGHGIRLAVRLPRDIDQARVFGFDARAWQKEGLVDVVTVTPRFGTNDSMMPLAEWKKELPGVEIWAGLETLVNRQGEGSMASPEVARGYAAQYLTAGADGVYLFNYMSAGSVNPRNGEVYNTCGDTKTLFSLPRRHVVTWQDTAPEGWEPYRPLPLKVKSGKTAVLQIETGYIPAGAKVSFLIGTDKPLEAGQLSLLVNGRACTFAGEDELMGYSESTVEPVKGGYCEDENAHFYRFTLGDASGLPSLSELTFSAGKSVKIVYAEADVEP